MGHDQTLNEKLGLNKIGFICIRNNTFTAEQLGGATSKIAALIFHK